LSGFEKPATAEDVRACYRIFLEREPENAEAVDGQLVGNPRLRELVERFKDCGEALRRQLDRGAALMLGEYGAGGVEVDIPSAQAGKC